MHTLLMSFMRSRYSAVSFWKNVTCFRGPAICVAVMILEPWTINGVGNAIYIAKLWISSRKFSNFFLEHSREYLKLSEGVARVVHIRQNWFFVTFFTILKHLESAQKCQEVTVKRQAMPLENIFFQKSYKFCQTLTGAAYIFRGHGKSRPRSLRNIFALSCQSSQYFS